MQKIFDEVVTLDKRCYEEFCLSEDILMEHASEELAQCVRKHAKPKAKILFVCGPGNNGGDGMACARILHLEYSVSIYMPYGVKSKMARLQLKRFESIGGRVEDKVAEADIYVDALFGSGLRRELDEKSCDIIRVINSKDVLKISCDIPSGIGENFISDEVFRADYSVVMGALKLPLFEDYAKDFVGEIEVANLGVSKSVYEVNSDVYLLEKKDMKLPFRKKLDTNKGTFGHTCIVQGDKKGAGILAATAALNFGSGLVTVMTNDDEQIPPYLMSSSVIPEKSNSIVIGMGLGERKISFKSLTSEGKALVIDADLFYHKEIIEFLDLRDNIILTPHPKEFSSLLEICDIAKVDTKEIQTNRFKFVRKFAKRFPNITLVLKGANTIITKNEKIYVNILGTNSLSKGGSGDVLAGMIGSLLAQGYESKDAAITAVLAHSLAAKQATCNNYALNPLDICEEIKCL